MLQRAVGPAPLTLEPDAFEAGLTTRQNSSVVGGLGHEVSPSAPSGLVSGLASVAAPDVPHPDSHGPELALRRGGSSGRGFAAARKVDYSVQRRPGSIATPAPPSPPASAGPEFSTPEPPPRALPTAPAPDEHPVTYAEPPDEPRPLPVAELPPETEPSPAPPSAEPDVAVPADPAPTDAPTLAQRAPAEDAEDPPASDLQRAVDEQSLPLATPARSPRDRPQRRVGLGEPMREIPSPPSPSSASVQRSTSPPTPSTPSSPPPAAPPAPANVQRSVDAAHDAVEEAAPGGTEAAEPSQAPLLGADAETEGPDDEPAADVTPHSEEGTTAETDVPSLSLAGTQRAKATPGEREDEGGASGGEGIAPLLGSETPPSGPETLAIGDPEPTAGGAPEPTAGGDPEPELPLGVQRAPTSSSSASASSSTTSSTSTPPSDASAGSAPAPGDASAAIPPADAPSPAHVDPGDGGEPGPSSTSPLLGSDVDLTVTDGEGSGLEPGVDGTDGPEPGEAAPLPLATQRAAEGAGGSRASGSSSWPQTAPQTAPLLGDVSGAGVPSALATSLAVPRSPDASAVQRAADAGPATRASLRSTPSGPIAPLLHARATPLAQRAPGPPSPAHPSGPAMRSETAPAAVVQRVAEATGADLSGVSVQRGADVGRSASAMSAKAYTTGGQVHLPDHHGSTSSGEGESLVAHELTHVAQQRALGGALPEEDTPRGQELELQAQHVERSVVEGKPLPLAVPRTGHTLQRSAQPSGHASAASGAATSPPNPAAFAVANGLGVPTSDGGVVFHAAMDAGVLASVTEPTDSHVQRAVDDAAPEPGVQRFIGKVPPPVTAASSTGAAASTTAGGAASGGAEDVEKIVDRVITRLRTELSLNRERLGRSLDL